jgi:hypothetical protein
MFHKIPILLVFSSFFFSCFLQASPHPTDYKLFEEFLSIEPNVKKAYVWFGNEGEVFVYFEGSIMQIDSWHIHDH